MKEGQKFKLIKWNKQLISVAIGILLVSQLTVGPAQVLAETTDNASPNSSEKIDSENQLNIGTSGELVTTENQDSDGNSGVEGQASATRGTTRNGASPQIGEVTTEQGLKDAITNASTTGAPAIVLSGTIDIRSAIDISGKEITLTSTSDATLKRVGSYTGSVLTVQNTGNLTINGVNVDGNEDNKGTAGSSLISLTNATFTLESGNIMNGNSSDNGGAINTSTGISNTININGGTISNNEATNNGGAIYTNNFTNKININDGVITGNKAAYGGGISGGSETEIMIDGGEISDNEATTGNGGGIWGTKITLNNGVISGNEASDSGGGIYTVDGGPTVGEININGGEISGNQAIYGGGIFTQSNRYSINVNITGGEISSNTATINGGGICLDRIGGEPKLDITGGIISNNTASTSGSAIANNDGTITMIGGLIYGVADAATDLVYSSSGGTLTGPTENGAIIAKSASNSSPYEWATATDLNAKFGEKILSQEPYWTIKGDAVGIGYLKGDSSESFIPITDAKIKLTGDLLDTTDKTYTGTAQEVSPSSDHADFITAFDKEVSLEYQAGVGEPKTETMTNAGTYKVFAEVTAGSSKLFAEGKVESQVTINTIKRTEADFDYPTKSNLTYTGEEQTINDEIEAKNKAEISDFSVSYIKKDDPDNKALEKMTDAGTYSIKITINEDNNKNYHTPDGIIIEDAVTVDQAQRTEKDFKYDKATNLTYKGTGLKTVVTAKNPTVITDFSVSYIKDGDPSNKELTEMTEAGTYSIRIKINTDTDANYDTPVAFTLSDAKVVVKAQESEKKQPEATMYGATIPTSYVYDGKAPEIAISSKGEDLGTISSIFKQDGKEVNSPNVGTYQVYARNTGSDKYNGADTLLGEFTITAKPLTISVADVEVQQNELLPIVTINYTDFAEGEDENTIFSELPTGEYVGDSSKAGTSAIEINEGTKKDAADNYELTYQSGTLTVKENPAVEEDRVPLYRVYNKNNGEHLYTISQSEAQGLVDKGWQDEGIGWYGAEKSGKPVYRLYNKNSGEHFYTLDKGEYDSVANAGWVKEDISFYAAEDTEIPIYRVFNPNSKDAGSHHYTLSKDENTWLIQEGWQAEGTAFYGK